MVRVKGVQLRSQVLQREEADVRDRVPEVGVPWRRDAETALPVTDERRRGRLGDVGAHAGTQHRQVTMWLLQPV